MHLIWVNLIPNLVLFWTGKFKDLDHDGQDYVIMKTVWEVIGEATFWAGETIPAAFGSRIPNVVLEKAHMIAETYSIWTLYLAPVLLKGRFLDECYYNHFVKLVQLLTCCIDLEITHEEIDDLDQNFQKWVQDYEQFYCQDDPDRVSCCPLTVHALLHIAPTIRAMGPVWAYWVFPMEHYCGDVLCNIRSRRFPYSSINRYVTSHAQLTHITLLYNLDEKLCLQPPASHDWNLTLPLYLLYVLTPPMQSTESINHSLWMKLTVLLATCLDVTVQTIRQLIPKDSQFIQYGRVYQLEGGDVMRAHELNPPQSDSRDMSFIWVCIDVSDMFELRDFYGQLLRLLIINIPESQNDRVQPQTLVYALIKSVKLIDCTTDGIKYYANFGSMEFVDLNQVKCVIGRIMDRGRWAIVDCSTSSA
ncbi:hypothetical protein L208DRAFT_1237679 [Tricholoma matsutake]|nr:hypothetical protein L208DRAFT_1237679 [Tricholoma matsutake 945]